MSTRRGPFANPRTRALFQAAGRTCEICGMAADRVPGGSGKLRRPHLCPHGRQCVRGMPGPGATANHATCTECAAAGRSDRMGVKP